MEVLGTRKEIQVDFLEPWRNKTPYFPVLHMANRSRFGMDTVFFPV